MHGTAFGDERGATATIIALTIVVLFGFGAFAMDLGKLWQDRRHVVNASDASALAAAQEYARGGDGCGFASGYVVANDPDAEVASCDPGVIFPTHGYVTVKARTPVDFFFAGIVGVADQTVSSTTTASYQVAQTVRGLRPFGLCSSIAETMLTIGGAHKVYYDKETQLLEGNPALVCPENTAGNWGLIHLAGGQRSGTDDLKEWTRNGYEGSVSAGTLPGDTGFRSALGKPPGGSPLDAIVSTPGNERVFCLPVYSAVDNPGNNADFTISGFAAVTLWSFEWTGAGQDAYLELRVEDPGLCAAGDGNGPPVLDFGARTVRICAVDFAENLSGCVA